MSAGYAERLSEYPNKGVCGLPENFDSERAFASKLDSLTKLIKKSNYTVVLTGAGISTSAGIPDFRGPNGIWTKEQEKRKLEKEKHAKAEKRRRLENMEQKKRKKNGGGVEDGELSEGDDESDTIADLHRKVNGSGDDGLAKKEGAKRNGESDKSGGKQTKKRGGTSEGKGSNGSDGSSPSDSSCQKDGYKTPMHLDSPLDESDDDERRNNINSTWVNCDKCQKWRRLNGIVIASNLPEKWYCSMNEDDPEYATCSAPEEKYDGSPKIKNDISQPTSSDSSLLAISSAGAAAVGAASASSSNGTDHSTSPGDEKIESKPSNSTSNGNKQISFATAEPTYTHKALTHLILHPPPSNSAESDSDTRDDDIPRRTYLHHIVTQNVDGLHRKTKLPRQHQSILHGCIFTEICDTCNTEHVRPYEISSIGLKLTGRKCTLGGDPPGTCPGKLKDTLLDWEDDLPEEDWQRAQVECDKANLILCLGTSLRIEPAAGLCELAAHPKKKKKKGVEKRQKLGYVIVNLQKTPYDDGAKLVIRGKVDDVMKGLMTRLGFMDNWDMANDDKENWAGNCKKKAANAVESNGQESEVTSNVDKSTQNGDVQNGSSSSGNETTGRSTSTNSSNGSTRSTGGPKNVEIVVIDDDSEKEVIEKEKSEKEVIVIDDDDN